MQLWEINNNKITEINKYIESENSSKIIFIKSIIYLLYYIFLLK